MVIFNSYVKLPEGNIVMENSTIFNLLWIMYIIMHILYHDLPIKQNREITGGYMSRVNLGPYTLYGVLKSTTKWC
jgi:hypothetical protein